MTWIKAAAWTIGGAVALAAVALLAIEGRGVGTRGDPSWAEARAALFLRSWLIPRTDRSLKNPVTVTPAVIAEAREHFADHCASCHANDGSGRTEMGQALYPRAPDMRAARTQQLTDGELFYIIEHGVRLTGMPAWTSGTPEGETSSWHLVHFIRHLPSMTAEEAQSMEPLNPRSIRDIEHEREVQEFLNGGTPPTTDAGAHEAHGTHGGPHE